MIENDRPLLMTDYDPPTMNHGALIKLVLYTCINDNYDILFVQDVVFALQIWGFICLFF